jgi:CRP/FNR family transcriptional regulator, cyclic AMP receptor protein
MYGSDGDPLGRATALEPLFQTQAFADLYGGVSRYKAASGSTIYRQEETADCLHYLEQGRIVLRVASHQGKEAIIGVLDAGAFFGEECLTSRTVRWSTAICLVDGLAARIEKASIVRAIRDDPHFAVFYLRRVVSRGDALKSRLNSQLVDGSEQRLARILLRLASLEGAAAAGSVSGFDQEALAQMVGTTRSRVNYFMNRFRDLGHVRYDGHHDGTITVHDSLWKIVHGQDRGDADLPDADRDDFLLNR